MNVDKLIKPDSTLRGNNERRGTEDTGIDEVKAQSPATITPDLESWKNDGDPTVRDHMVPENKITERIYVEGEVLANCDQAQAGVILELDSPHAIRDLVINTELTKD